VQGRASVDTELMKRSVAHYLEPTSRIVALAMMELRVGRRTPASIEQDGDASSFTVCSSP
jgi:hypothetical protein